jgi:prevent-host-death family protein
MTRLAASEARHQFAEVVNQVAFGGERIVLHRHGKDVAALVPVADLELLEQLENRMDLDAAREALREKGGRVKWSKLKKELDL